MQVQKIHSKSHCPWIRGRRQSKTFDNDLMTGELVWEVLNWGSILTLSKLRPIFSNSVTTFSSRVVFKRVFWTHLPHLLPKLVHCVVRNTKVRRKVRPEVKRWEINLYIRIKVDYFCPFLYKFCVKSLTLFYSPFQQFHMQFL